MAQSRHTIVYQHVQSAQLKDWFADTLRAYPELLPHPIYLRRLYMRYSTMRARPVINWQLFFRGRRHYRVDFGNRLEMTDNRRLEQLPREVVVGWFAHELGHIVDYLHRPWQGIIAFGLGYALWSRYMREAERRADTIAVDHGFGSEILATKHFLMKEATLPAHYRARLKKYYLSADEIEALIVAYEERGELPDIVPI